MYKAVHSLVGSSRTLGILRLGEILNSMQICVTSTNSNPDFERFNFLYDFAEEELKHVELTYDWVKT